MAYGVILKHLEVDKITWGSFFSKKKQNKIIFFKEARERGAGCPFFNWCGEHWYPNNLGSEAWE
jgi:hypothetical protein